MFLRILNGGGEKKYPASSFVLNCKGMLAKLMRIVIIVIILFDPRLCYENTDCSPLPINPPSSLVIES